jgi:hypothetical protein
MTGIKPMRPAVACSWGKDAKGRSESTEHLPPVRQDISMALKQLFFVRNLAATQLDLARFSVTIDRGQVGYRCQSGTILMPQVAIEAGALVPTA